MKKNLLLLYKGYPRISQTYQIDEAKILYLKYNIMIISWDWTLKDIDSNAPEYLYGHPNKFISNIKNFKPDIIHSHFLDTIEIVYNLSVLLDVKFTIRTHSYDMLINNKSFFNTCQKYINSKYCIKIITFPAFSKYLIDEGIDESKIFTNYPQININMFLTNKNIDNGQYIMGCGSILKKKILSNLF
jgi:hypothetical protein